MNLDLPIKTLILFKLFFFPQILTLAQNVTYALNLINPWLLFKISYVDELPVAVVQMFCSENIQHASTHPSASYRWTHQRTLREWEPLLLSHTEWELTCSLWLDSGEPSAWSRYTWSVALTAHALRGPWCLGLTGKLGGWDPSAAAGDGGALTRPPLPGCPSDCTI